MEILLNDEKIMACQGVNAQCDDNSHKIAKAQLKAVVEFIDWLDNGTRSSASWRSETRKFRQALKKEAGL